MILAEDEVAIGVEHDGIMVLDDALAAGTPLADVLPIATDVLELEITPNRPDCLGVYGVAREVHAATGAPLAPAPWSRGPHPAGDAIPGFSVEVRDARPVPALHRAAVRGRDARAVAAVAEGAADGRRPAADQQRRRHHELRDAADGQPMHAFDADLVAGGTLVVRRARDGETMTTLDDVERTLDADMCVIDDADGPTSIAGVMGGARSEVRDGTTRVLMEAATWNGPNIQRTSTRLGAAHRGVRAVREAAPARAGPRGPGGRGEADGRAVRRAAGRRHDRRRRPGPGRPATLRLRDARTERLLGAPVPRADAGRILAALGFGVAEAADGLDVTVPYWRRDDVTREADLIEEVARIWGLDRPPATLPSRRGAVGRLAPEQRLRRRAEDALVGAGLSEAVGWSFPSPGRRAPARARPTTAPVALENPMSEDQSVMRTTLLGSLLDSLRRNRSRGFEDVRLFEYGAVYLEARGPAANGGEPTGNPWYPRPDPALPSSAAPRRAAHRPACGRRAGATPSRRAPTSSPPRACSRR